MRRTGFVLVGLVVAAGLLSLLWAPFDPARVEPGGALLPPLRDGHLLGTDGLGRDVFSQVLVGARATLAVGVAAVLIASVLGVPLGVAAGMAGGWPSELVMRTTDLMLAFPALLLALVLAAAFGASAVTGIVAVGISSVPVFARVSRAATLQVMAQEYVTAARACGRRAPGVAVRHVLPNVAPVLLVQATVAFAIAVTAEAALSYLGLGVQAPTPSWGRMLHENQAYLFTNPELVCWPALAIGLTVLGFNLAGDVLADRLDPARRARP
ncbi:ABC transporter permease [Actinomadura fibrosa]|uniref:ABC transporter permease n=1 Tax=Actinomadura fibrosa TaxID=111802 RepID=A0ABW2XVT1_9ACTN|nr:ABC transporter permease [Actinomadura fibrosa]